MNIAQRIWSFMPRGVREPLALLVIAGVVALAGRYSGAVDLYAPLALWPSEFWHGRVWQVVTYPLLPNGMLDLIFNGFFFVMLGARLVQVWGRRQFWLFCLVAVLGAATVKFALTPFNRTEMVGLGGVIFAMFVAWGRVLGNEEMMLMGVWRMKMRTAILLGAGLTILFSLLSPGRLWNTLPILGGGAVGWLYLAAQERWLRRRPAQQVASDRISRLEL